MRRSFAVGLLLYLPAAVACGGSVASDPSLLGGGADGESDATTTEVAGESGSGAPVVGSSAEARRLVADETHLYWVSAKNGGSVARMPLVGGAVEPFGVGGHALSIHAGHVFWSDDSTPSLGAILARPSDESTSQSPVGEVHGTCEFLAVDDTRAFWTESPGGRYRIAVRNLTSADRGVVIEDIPTPTGLAFDGKRLFFSSADGAIYAADLLGATPLRLAGDQANPAEVSVAAGALFWINRGDLLNHAGGALMTMPASGGAPRPVMSFEDEATTYRLDGDVGYVATWNGKEGSVRSVRPGDLGLVASGLDAVISLVVAGDSVYGAEANGKIVRFPKR